MSCLSVNVQQRFTNLRKKLDQLGYMQPLSIDSLPLVENLFTDLVWTTDSFRKCKLELDKRLDIREKLEDYIEPYKKDNGRHLSENNRLQKKIIELKLEYEERLRDLSCQLRHVEEEKEDLKLFNAQCFDKLKKYEVEAKLMVDKIMQLQEKNFQAVVHIPEGKRKQIPFRRQRMDIDFLIPRNESSDSGNDRYDDHCCSGNKDSAGFISKQSDSCSCDKADILESVTNKCQELTEQLRCATEELELNDRKLENYSEQVVLYEEEIQRLTKELSGGRTIESLSLENQNRSRDRIHEQLCMQIDLLQQRNEELEKEVIRCNALNIKDGKVSGYKDRSSIKYDNDCMLEIQNRKLLDRIDELVNREKCLLRELHCVNSRLTQRDNDCIPTIADSLEREIQALQEHIKTLEGDRSYWKKEAECNAQDKNDVYRKSIESDQDYNNRKSINDSDNISNKVNDINEIDELQKELKHCRHKLKDIMRENNELKQVLESNERNSSPPVKDKDHSRQYEVELKKVRMERDSLQELLDKFERQLHDIQGNIRVLTQERDMINDCYQGCQREVHELRESLIQSEKPRKDSGTNQPSLAVQSMLRRLEVERDQSLNDLHKMTTERDSLRERLKTVTDSAISEKARLCQRLEDLENQISRLLEEKEELIDKATVLRNKIGELEEHNHQLAKKNDSLTSVIEKERSVMQEMNSDLQRFQNEVQKKERRESQLSEELKNSENRISNLQERLESQNNETIDYKNENMKLKDIVNELDREKDQMQSDVDDKIEQLKDVHMQLKVKEDALNEIRINMTSLEQQLRRINEVNNHRDQELRALVLHNEQLEKDLRHQVSKFDQLKAENTRLEEDLMCLTREHHKVEAEYRDVHRCLMDVNQDKEQLEQKIMHFQKLGNEQKEQNDEMLEQYRQLSLDYEKLQINIQKLERDNDELRADVNARENVVCRMREQLLITEREISTSQSNIQHLEDQVRSLNQVLETNGQVTENHSLEKHEILQELAAMRDLCARLESSKENVQRQLSSRLLENEQLKSENSEFFKENENLREEIQSLLETIRNLETVMSVGREKEFMNEMEFQQKIAELESENEHLAHLPSKIDQLHHDLKKQAMCCAELEAECEKLRRQLTSEKFKLELANQEIRRRQKTYQNGCLTDRAASVENREMCHPSERQNESEFYRTDSSFSDNCIPLTSAGFCSDMSIPEKLLCNHGCYHSKDCNNTYPGNDQNLRCNHGCKHSETCLGKTTHLGQCRTPNRINRNCIVRKHRNQCYDKNSNNHEREKSKNSKSQHFDPNCPHYKSNKPQISVSLSTANKPIEKNVLVQTLPTIHSESDGKNKSTESIYTDEDRNSTELTNNVHSETVKSTAYKKADERLLKQTFYASQNLSTVELQITHLNNHLDTAMNLERPKSSINFQIPLRKPFLAEATAILSAMPDHLKPLPAQASIMTNDVIFSNISHDTYSTKVPLATSTLAQVPSIVSENEVKSDPNINDDEDQNNSLTISELNQIVDQDPTDVSESLSHSFYNLSGESHSETDNSSSGVHTGRSFYTHTPTQPLSSSNNNNNNDTNVSDIDTRIASDRTEPENTNNLDENSIS